MSQPCPIEHELYDSQAFPKRLMEPLFLQRCKECGKRCNGYVCSAECEAKREEARAAYFAIQERHPPDAHELSVSWLARTEQRLKIAREVESARELIKEQRKENPCPRTL